MVAGLALLVALQGPVVTARVNRTEVMYGDTIVLSITVSTKGIDWVRLIDPELVGLEAIGSQQVSDVRQTDEGEERRTERTVVLRASQVGDAMIGSVVVRQGRTTARTGPISITVGGTAPPNPGANPLVAALLERPPPPGNPDEVSLYIIPSRDTVRIGQQLDVVLLAWVPRSLTRRLRAAPTLDPPEFSGAWVYETNEGTETIEEREYDGHTYDLYFHHQTVFPLSEEGFAIGRATVTYNLPLTDSFMSRELRHVVKSEEAAVTILGRPAPPDVGSFSGSVADSLMLTASVTREVLNVGDAGRLTVTLEGRGNVALWGEPTIRFPAGLNAYPERGEVRASRMLGRVRGTKNFEFLLVPDSVGSLPISISDYVVFSPATGEYAVIPGLTLTVVATGPTGVVPAGAPGATLVPIIGPPAAADLINDLPLWIWLVLWLLPPTAYVVAKLLSAPATRTAKLSRSLSPLSKLNAQFLGVLDRIIVGGATLPVSALLDGMIAGGVEPSLAAHAAGLKERISLAQYGPEGGGDQEELAAEVKAVSAALISDKSPSYGKRLSQIAVLVLLVGTTSARAQDITAERLYQAGAFRLAVDSLAIRATNEPALAAHWYNLAVARNRIDDKAGALAALIRAARLAPRNSDVRNALRANAAWRTRGGPFISPITPQEAFLIALAAWFVGWVAAIARRRKAAGAAFLLCAAGVAASVAVGMTYRRPMAIVAPEDLTLREAPFRSAPEITTLGGGDPVTVMKFSGAWLFITHRGAAGWVLAADVVRI